jgi:hypothetical protein
MARRFNGTSDYIDFTVSPALQSLDAGPMTMVAVVKPNDTVDGALIHARTSGGTNCWWMEIFGGNWNYGQALVARDIGDVNTTDGWYVLIGRKADGGTAQPRGRKIILGGSTTDVTAPSAMADGSTPGSGGILRTGRWGTSTDYLSADIAALAVFGSDLSDGTTATFTTYQAILDATPAWAVKFTQANAGDAIPDDSADGTGDSTTINGTTIVSDPANFFGGSTVNLTPASMPFTAVALNPVPQPVTIALTPATLAFGAIGVNPVPQPVTVALTRANMAFTAVAVTPVPGQVSMALTPAVLTLTAVALGTGAVGSVNLTPALFALSGVGLNPVPQPVVVGLVPAILTLQSRSLTPVAQPVVIVLTPATITFVAVAILPPITNEQLPEPILVSVFMRTVNTPVGTDVVIADVPIAQVDVVVHDGS